LCRGTSTGRRLQVNTESPSAAGWSWIWRWHGPSLCLACLGTPRPPHSLRATTGPRLPIICCQPWIIYFISIAAFFYSITLYQMEQLFDIWWPWVRLLQWNRDRSDIDCQLLASRLFVAARLMLFMHWRALCETAESDLQYSMGQSSALYFLQNLFTSLQGCCNVPLATVGCNIHK
jgi:hypothetical protein